MTQFAPVPHAAGNMPPPAATPAVDSAELRHEVRAAARDLVDDLRRAEERTRESSGQAPIDAAVDAALDRCLARLAATGCWGEANRLPSGELWKIAGPILQSGSLQLRAREKPRGYAGDYELLAAIAEKATCGHPLGSAMDRYFLRQAAPRAVRSRNRVIAAAIIDHRRRREGPYRVLSVGSGPAVDVELALRDLPADARRGVRVTLLDMDPQALDHARARLARWLPGKAIRPIRTNLARLPRAQNRDELLPSAETLICPGLFDYLDDAAGVDMLRLLYARLAPGGTLLVGNFDPHNPTRAYMEWIGNWYLIYRTAEDLHRLARAAEIPEDRYHMTPEPTGLDLFLTATTEG